MYKDDRKEIDDTLIKKDYQIDPSLEFMNVKVKTFFQLWDKEDGCSPVI